MEPNEKVDLEPFREASRRKVRWEQRAEMIYESFPSTKNLDWKKAFDEDIDMFGRIVRDILKLDYTEPKRPGPRPTIGVEYGKIRLRQLMGEDYSMVPFPETFRTLAGDRSLRALARKCGLDFNRVYRLMSGKIEPDSYSMEAIAKAFGREPTYFLEYRVLLITKAIIGRLENAPESTISILRKLQGVDA